MHDAPKWQRRRRPIREETQKCINKYLLAPIANVCVQYLYHPTFKNISCFETCGILRLPIGNVMGTNTRWLGFHNARCPLYPEACIFCGEDIRIHCLVNHEIIERYGASITDQPIMLHDRHAMMKYVINNHEHHWMIEMVIEMVICGLAIIIEMICVILLMAVVDTFDENRNADAHVILSILVWAICITLSPLIMIIKMII